MLRFFADPVGRMRALYGQYGPLAALVDRSPALILACGAEHNREVLTRPDLFQHNSEIPVRTPPGSALARFNQVLPFLNGDVHHRRRRLMQPALQRSAIEAYAPDIAAVTEATLRSWPTGVQVDLAALIRALTAAVVIRCLFGLDPGGRGEELARSEAELLQALSSPLTIALPLPLPGTPYRRALTRSAALEGQLRALLVAKRAQSPAGSDVLATLLAARDEAGNALTDGELLGECNGLFVAGHDTTAQTLVWTIFLLTQHPERQAELLAEQDAILAGAPPRPAELSAQRVRAVSVVSVADCVSGVGDVARPAEHFPQGAPATSSRGRPAVFGLTTVARFTYRSAAGVPRRRTYQEPSSSSGSRAMHRCHWSRPACRQA